LVERLQEHEEKTSVVDGVSAGVLASPTQYQQDDSNLSTEQKIEKYLIGLVKYYIMECGGYASSRDLGRFLATNQASNHSHSKTALQELKDHFGGVAAFLNQRSQVFKTVREPSDGDPNNFSFGIELRKSTDISNVTVGRPQTSPSDSVPSYSSNSTGTSNDNLHSNRGSSGTKPNGPSQRARSVDPNISSHIEDLIKEYLQASGGEASSRNIGRYLAANAAWNSSETSQARDGKRKTANKQLKDSFGSLAYYLSTKEDTFETIKRNFQSGQGEDDPPSEHSFGVRLR